MVAGFILSSVSAAGTYKITVIMASSRPALETDQSSFEKAPWIDRHAERRASKDKNSKIRLEAKIDVISAES